MHLHTRISLAALLMGTAALSVVLSGCTSPSTLPTITVSSPTDGQRILGSRSLTLSGILEGGPVTAFEVSLNGAPVGAASNTATTFSAPLDLDDGDNAIVVSATSSAGTITESLTVTYPFLGFSDFAAASVVIGQPDFTSDSETLTSTGIGDPYGNPALANGVFYAPDYDNDRVLGFLGGIPSSNGAAADFVLGQPDFTTNIPGDAADAMYSPQTVTTAGGKLFVAEYGNNRVLVWNTPPTTTQVPADLVVGQPGFGSGAHDCTATGLDSLEGVFAYGDKLFIADSSNNRVLIYNSLPTANSAAADVVLGQADFVHCASNDDDQDGTHDTPDTPTARTLDYPSDVWTDGTRLVVADSDNNRVLIWNAMPTSNFQPADVVIGQVTMTTSFYARGADGMDEPYFLGSNGNQLFVADSENNRVLVFDSVPTANGASADHVLGQGDFTHVTVNDDDQDGVADAGPSARTLSFPSGVLVTDDALVVADNDNARMLVFRP